MNKDEMLPCPFCGAAGVIIKVPDTKRFQPQCSGCGVSFGDFNLRGHAEWVWNTRAEIEAMARDAERYRWLRKQLEVTRNNAVPDRVGIRKTFILVELRKPPKNDAAYIDQAIDAAMSEHSAEVRDV